MQEVDPGHKYQLDVYDDNTDGFFEHVTFMKREGPKYPGNVGHHPGTNIQEVLRACIERMKYLDAQDHDHLNKDIMHSLRHALYLLELRAARRHNLVIPSMRQLPEDIETLATCRTCGHLYCMEEDHYHG